MGILLTLPVQFQDDAPLYRFPHYTSHEKPQIRLDNILIPVLVSSSCQYDTTIDIVQIRSKLNQHPSLSTVLRSYFSHRNSWCGEDFFIEMVYPYHDRNNSLQKFIAPNKATRVLFSLFSGIWKSNSSVKLFANSPQYVNGSGRTKLVMGISDQAISS